MKVAHIHLAYIMRSCGGSVVGFAAYCSGERLRSEYDGRLHHRPRTDVIFKTVLLPENAPEEYRNREVLWNSVEMSEGRNAQLARTIDLDFPVELSHEHCIELICSYVQENFVDRGMCADIAVHDRGKGNPHAHAILTLRGIDEDGRWQPKWRKNYRLDENGDKLRDPDTGRYLCGPSIPLNDWSDKGNAEIWRREWAKACNQALERIGSRTRVTHKSYVRQGINREPQIHLGRKVCALEERGIHTDRGQKNREIIDRNKKRTRNRDKDLGRSR